MIADKILPSFYMIEAEGKAADAIVSGPFGIQKIIVGSKDFKNDLDATEAMRECVDFMTRTINPDWNTITETIDFNPEFFPSLKPEKLSDEQKKMIMEIEIAEIEAGENLKEGQVAVSMTRLFDPVGDYIQSRWLLKHDEFMINAKVGVNPDKYMQDKVADRMETMSHITSPRQEGVIYQ
jgi:hypothetical protein